MAAKIQSVCSTAFNDSIAAELVCSPQQNECVSDEPVQPVIQDKFEPAKNAFDQDRVVRKKIRDTFDNPDSTILDKMGATVAGILFLPFGCAAPTDPDEPLEYPEKPDAGEPTHQPDAGTPSCQPDNCPTGIIQNDSQDSLLASCIQFMSDRSFPNQQEAVTAISLVDFNNDGKLDVYLINKRMPNRLFLNNDGLFTDITAGTGLAEPIQARKAIWNDFDNDGDKDVFFVGETTNQLFENNNGHFELLTSGLGIRENGLGKDAVWIGSDLLLATENGLRYYRYLGNKRFEEKTADSGLTDFDTASRLAVSDYDADGDLDVYVAKETGPNTLYQNQGNGTFTKDMALTESTSRASSTDAEWVTLAPGEKPSLYVSNWQAPNNLYVRQPNGSYVDMAGEMGLTVSGKTVKSTWADFLNNGHPALFVARYQEENQLFIPANSPNKPYAEVAHPLFIDTPQKITDAQWIDINGDGLSDLILASEDQELSIQTNLTVPVKTCQEN